LTREKQNYDVKKRILRKQKEGALGASISPAENMADSNDSLKESMSTTLERQANGRALHIDRNTRHESTMVNRMASLTFQGITFIPRKML